MQLTYRKIFFSSVRRSVNLNNISNPKKDIEEGTLYKAGGYTYAVIGVHARADENQQFKRFIVVGRDFYIQVNKIEEDLGQEYYVAEKVFKKIKSDDYYFFLAKGQLKYTTDREKIALETKAVMESLADDTYIKIWDEYGEIERETILQEARDFGALRYTSYEQIGRDYRFDISSDNPERFSAFAKKFERGDILAASIMNPFDVQRENQEFEEYLDKHKNYIANIRLAEDIDPSSGSIIFTVDDQEARKISVAQQGYIFVSIMGDKKRLDRREQARTKIESRQCPIGKLIDDVRNANNDDTYSIKMDALVKELSRMCCFDSDLVYDFYDADPSFMTEMALYVVASLRKQLAKCERVGENYKPRKQDVKRYIAYMLAILTLLRLRDPDRAGLFPVLEVASDNSKKLARELRILDDYMSKERPINPAIRFKLNKPDSLSKMSDLCYALDLYLNGDKQAASIEVVGVDEDD